MIRARRRKLAVIVFIGFGAVYLLSVFLEANKFIERLRGSFPYDEDGCGCPRYAPPIAEGGNVSLCSGYSTARGVNQRVIAYTIYGNHSNEKVLSHYYNQIEDRIKEAKFYYDGWIVRLYHNASRTDKFTNGLICKLYCLYPNFDPCQVNDILIPDVWFTDKTFAPYSKSRERIKAKTLHNIGVNIGSNILDFLLSFVNPLESHYEDLNPNELKVQENATEEQESKTPTKIPFQKVLIGKLWRFLPLGDDLVSMFLVRDVDSFLLPREVAAVTQWLENSTALVHAMRDHPSHNGLILAGLWGAAKWRDSNRLSSFLKEMLRFPPREIWDYDQILLQRIIWPNVLDQILIHDSYHCVNPFLKAKHRAIPFPTKRRGRVFVSWGPYRSPSEIRNIVPCPVECRPRDHQDWILC